MRELSDLDFVQVSGGNDLWRGNGFDQNPTYPVGPGTYNPPGTTEYDRHAWVTNTFENMMEQALVGAGTGFVLGLAGAGAGCVPAAGAGAAGGAIAAFLDGVFNPPNPNSDPYR